MASGCFKSTCSFRLAPPYQSLQWCIEDTLHSEKRAISELSESPAELRLAEFKRFAGVRAGHRLQLLNVLDVLQNHGLSFEHTSVAMLICQTIWQSKKVTRWHGLYIFLSPVLRVMLLAQNVLLYVFI